MRLWINLFESQADDIELLGREIEQWEAPQNMSRPRPQDWEMFKKVRHYIRHYEGGGGMCHQVSEWVEAVYGWRREAGSYCKDGDVCFAAHYWNILPDGSILDLTSDQMGEGDDMRLIPVSDPLHSRYDEEWYQDDFNPQLPEYERYIPTGGRDPKSFSGESDFDQENRLRGERGDDWWATHLDQLQDYLDMQKKYSKGTDYEPYIDSRLNALRKRIR